jgi:dTMP kinase
MPAGFLISFEGSEGCGKSTQITRLRAHLERSGREVLLLREPGGTKVGEHIRHLLQHEKEAANMTPEAELLLFAASRAQIVREKIRPALDRGAVVMMDRFLDSTTVYQGLARGLPMLSVRAINDFAVGGAKPHLTIVLDMDATTAWNRIHATGRELDRMEDQPLEFFQKVRDGYLDLARAEPERVAVLDASQSIDAIGDKIIELVEARLHHGLQA